MLHFQSPINVPHFTYQTLKEKLDSVITNSYAPKSCSLVRHNV